ncbi:MAG: hypothetical protein H7327_14235 [Herminiimonas sp.]|nr:hypothetical protein [Herminiimonas sp.]
MLHSLEKRGVPSQAGRVLRVTTANDCMRVIDCFTTTLFTLIPEVSMQEMVPLIVEKAVV